MASASRVCTVSQIENSVRSVVIEIRLGISSPRTNVTHGLYLTYAYATHIRSVLLRMFGQISAIEIVRIGIKKTIRVHPKIQKLIFTTRINSCLITDNYIPV